MDKSRIHVKKKLVKVDHLQDNRIRIAFDDGESDIVDLLIAADGIRSVSLPMNSLLASS